MKKALGQTVRELKRGVNKKVLKVPGIEQKVLDATSNEPWGPHGTVLADIAQASRNYHEYQMIMAILWKRINDTGKNWRHVYKALTVLEYLIAYGSERVIDEIREHAYHISTLSDFQYIDSSGKDQGSNVRKKSQSLVVLVNDKERIQEARDKAAANRDKFRNASVGGMHRPGSYSSAGGYGDRYDDDRYDGRYGSRDDDRNGYGRERESGYRDDDRYGGRDGDRYNRDSDECYGKNDDYRGRSQSIDQHSSRSRSSERERDRGFEDDGQYSSRGSGARADDHSQDGSFSGRGLDRKSSEQDLGAPPSYEEAVGEGRSPVHSERDGETSAASADKTSVPHVSATSSQGTPAPASPPAPAPAPASPSPPAPASVNKEIDSFDEFDPRGSFLGSQTTSNGTAGAETDLLGSLSDSFSSNQLEIMPVTSVATVSEVNALATSGPTISVTSSVPITNQPFGDPFGDDAPFKALPSSDGVPALPQNFAPTSSFTHSANANPQLPQAITENVDTVNFGDTFSGITYTPSSNPCPQPPSTNAQFSPQELPTSNQEIDILADILPPSGPSPPVASQAGFLVQAGRPASGADFSAQSGQPPFMTGFEAQASEPTPQTSFSAQSGQPAMQNGFPTQTSQPQFYAGFGAQVNKPAPHTSFSAQSEQPATQSGFSVQTGEPTPHPGFLAQSVQPSPLTDYPAQTAQAPSLIGFPSQISSAPQTSFPSPSPQINSLQQYNANEPTTHYNAANFYSQSTPLIPASSQMVSQTPGGPLAQHSNDVLGDFSQTQPNDTMTSQPAPLPSTGSLAIVPQPAKDKKFEPKSAVWADTLSRGLVNFNISGPKTNPLADIGVDFEAMNRKEKRMEKPTTAPVTSAITMGKAMGSGTGMGRAGASALRAPPNPMVGSGMGMGMGIGSGPGGMNQNMGTGMGVGGYGGMNQNMGMGGYGGMNQNMGMGGGPGGYGGMNQHMGMGGGPGGYGGMNQNMGMGMGAGMNMGMGMGPGAPMQPTGFPPGSSVPGVYNPMMGRGGYAPQQPYGGFQ